MKPIKSLETLSVWIMRIGLLLFAYDQYFNTFTKFKIDRIEFYLACLFLIFSVIIFITGFVCKTTLTVVSAMVITFITIYNIVTMFNGGLDTLLILNVLVAAIAIMFISRPTCK